MVVVDGKKSFCGSHKSLADDLRFEFHGNNLASFSYYMVDSESTDLASFIFYPILVIIY